MGILSDFFLADPSDAPRYRPGSPGHLEPDASDLAEFKNLMNLQIEILWSILEGKEWDSAAHGLAYLEVGEEDEACLFQFPAALVSRIAALNESEISAAAASWAGTEELLRWEPEHAEEVIRELVRLSRRSLATGKGLFLWCSL